MGTPKASPKFLGETFARRKFDRSVSQSRGTDCDTNRSCSGIQFWLRNARRQFSARHPQPPTAPLPVVSHCDTLKLARLLPCCETPAGQLRIPTFLLPPGRRSKAANSRLHPPAREVCQFCSP